MTGIFNDFFRNCEVDIMVAKHVFHEINRVICYMTIISCRVLYGEVYLCLAGIFLLILMVSCLSGSVVAGSVSEEKEYETCGWWFMMIK